MVCQTFIMCFKCIRVACSVTFEVFICTNGLGKNAAPELLDETIRC